MKKYSILFIALMGLLLFGCSDATDNSSTGKLSLTITDSPFLVDWLDSAIVNIKKIEIRNKVDSSGSPFLVLSEEAQSVNLLDLRNGVTEELFNLDIPVGSYDLIRLYVESAKVKFTDGSVYDLNIPSGEQTGIKIFISPDIEVSGGLTAELLIDFDISKSFLLMGNPNSPADVKGVKFKPVIRAVNQSNAGRVSGTVSDTSDVFLADAQVWISTSDSVLTSSFTSESGAYQLIGIPAGSYTLSASIADYDTVTVENISVVSGNMTEQDFVLTPLP